MHIENLLLLGPKMSWPLTLLSLVVSFFLFQIVRGIYRITLHPLAKFPGPKLTAMTRWYEAYYEIKAGGAGGLFGDQIEKWHKQYGPIVRINPFELHIADPEYYDVLFNFDPQLEKRQFAIGQSLQLSLFYHSDFDSRLTIQARQSGVYSLFRAPQDASSSPSVFLLPRQRSASGIYDT